MGATDTILPYAVTYGEVILFAAPFMAASYTLNNLLRSEGLALVGMVGLGLGGLLNIAVCPVFMFLIGALPAQLGQPRFAKLFPLQFCLRTIYEAKERFRCTGVLFPKILFFTPQSLKTVCPL